MKNILTPCLASIMALVIAASIACEDDNSNPSMGMEMAGASARTEIGGETMSEVVGEEEVGDINGTESTEEQAEESYIPPTLGPNDPPPEIGRWAEYLPAGDTICSRGGEYRFYVRGGDPNKVIVDFEGGGACWDAFTCSIADAIFKDRVRPIADFTEALANRGLDGLYTNHREDDPFKDWTLIHVPYFWKRRID